MDASKRKGRAAFPKKRATRRRCFRYYRCGMKNVTLARFFALSAAALLLPAPAHAHSGHALAYACASGIAHPFHGWDHLLAMVAVGVWAAQLGDRARWLVPVAFVGVMTCAAA